MITAIIQARMGSTRLPGKVLMEVDGRPLLDYMLQRVKASRRIQQVVVATTPAPTDRKIVDFCRCAGVACFQGSEEDVLSRYHGAALAHNASVVVRMTSDCPLMDPRVADLVVEDFLAHPEARFVSNTVPLPCLYPDGMDVEVFGIDLLKEAHALAKLPSEREHVTFFMWKTGRYPIRRVDCPKDLSRYRFTVDYPQDFKLVEAALQTLFPANPLFTMEDLIAFVESQPHLMKAQEGIARNAGWQRAFDKDQQALRGQKTC